MLKKKSKKAPKKTKKKSLTIENCNWYGFNHKVVNEKFGGELTFINSFCVHDEYNPVAVYRAANPDTSKGHKRYMLLQTHPLGGGMVRGMTEEEMEKWRYQEAVHCTQCNKVMFSVNRHDYHKCGCPNETMVDGGRDYLRYGGKSLDKIKHGVIDFLTNQYKDA